MSWKQQMEHWINDAHPSSVLPDVRRMCVRDAELALVLLRILLCGFVLLSLIFERWRLCFVDNNIVTVELMAELVV